MEENDCTECVAFFPAASFAEDRERFLFLMRTAGLPRSSSRGSEPGPEREELSKIRMVAKKMRG